MALSAIAPRCREGPCETQPGGSRCHAFIDRDDCIETVLGKTNHKHPDSIPFSGLSVIGQGLRLFNHLLLGDNAKELIFWSVAMNELMSSGIELMLIGMGMVYAFLAMLIVAIKTMSALVLKFFPEMPAGRHAGSHHGEDLGTIAAISAAVHQYRNKYLKKEK